MKLNWRNKIFIIVTIILFIAAECNEKYIRFEKPIPENVKIQEKVHGNYLGRYYRVSKNFNEFIDADSVYLYIKEKIVVREDVLIKKFAREDFDTMKNLVIKDGLIYDLESEDKMGYPFEIENDSLVVKYKMADTTFNINQKDILKFYKKVLYLNKEVNGLYEVSRMKQNIQKGEIYFDHIQDSLDTQILQKIVTLVEIKSETDSAQVAKIEGFSTNLSKNSLKWVVSLKMKYLVS